MFLPLSLPLSQFFFAFRTPSILFLSHVSNQKAWYSLNSLPLSYIKPKTHMVEKLSAEASRSEQQQGRSGGRSSGFDLILSWVFWWFGCIGVDWVGGWVFLLLFFYSSFAGLRCSLGCCVCSVYLLLDWGMVKERVWMVREKKIVKYCYITLQ